LLLERGADVNAVAIGTTALHLAIGAGHTEMMQLLLDNEADVNAVGNCKRRWKKCGGW